MHIEFKLNMPGRASWNGAWSGTASNFTLVREVDDAIGVVLDGSSWGYVWNDGWRAEVSARVIHPGEPLTKSDGFNGYDWMVASILRYGKIYADHELPEDPP